MAHVDEADCSAVGCENEGEEDRRAITTRQPQIRESRLHSHPILLGVNR